MSEPGEACAEPFALRFRRELYRRTGGRIGGLEIEQHEDAIRISCTVPTYHVKQLVIVAALTALTGGAIHDVMLNVHVATAPPLAKGSGGDGAACTGPTRLSLSSRR